MNAHLKRSLILAALLSLSAHAVTISSDTPAGPLTLTEYDYTAGAFCSLTWKGVEFIDSKDHGRCLQSASSFDWLGEQFNPTEAGASYLTDGYLPAPSSSKRMNIVAGKSAIATETQMAFWNPVNGQKLSQHIHRKYVEVRGNVIEYRVAFEIPANETHSVAQFEILTGYMPASFSVFGTLNPATGTLAALSDGPGEQALPIIFTAPNAQHAIGIYSPTPLTGGGYGRWRYASEGGLVKWNAVARIENPKGTYRFRIFVVVGSLYEVWQQLNALAQQQ